jgi:hypothetical protein
MAIDSAAPTTNSGSTFVFALSNALLSPLLRSPLHRMVSKTFILLSFKGRKSGKTYTFPVGYTHHDNQVEVISSRSWWKNLRGDASVTLWLKGEKHNGVAEVFYGDETVVQALLPLAQRSSQLVKLYQIELDTSDQPKHESVRRAARTTALIRIHLTK